MFYQLEIIFMILFTLLSGVQLKDNNYKNIEIEYSEERSFSGSVTVKRGDELDVNFSIDYEVLACLYVTPRRKSYNMNRGAAYEDFRINQRELNDYDCAMKITDIKNIDNGQWNINITYRDTEGTYQIVTGSLHVTVAIPPDEVLINVSGSEPIKITDNTESFKCTATGAYPAPEFKWFISNSKELIEDNGNTKITPDIDDDNGRITYISTLTRKLEPSDHGKILRCEVEHAGFTDRQIIQKRNQYEIDLNLQFKPIEFIHREQNIDIVITFWANPKPDNGRWLMNGGSHGNFSSKDIRDGEIKGQYQVNLKNLDQSCMTYIEVTNNLGTGHMSHVKTIDRISENSITNEKSKLDKIWHLEPGLLRKRTFRKVDGDKLCPFRQ